MVNVCAKPQITCPIQSNDIINREQMKIKLPAKTIGYRPPTDTKPHVLMIRTNPPVKFNQTPVKI